MMGQHYALKSKSPKGQHFEERKQNKKSLSIILSVIALIEVILTMVSMTFAWFEGLTSLQMEGKNVPTASPLKSEIIVGESPDYGNATAKLNEFFEAQANAKFTPVSSFDGEHFYALYEGSAENYTDYYNGVKNGTLKFRELSREEINSNLLYFQFKVTATEDADVDFWFKEIPSFYINGTRLGNANNPFRIRIDDGTKQTASEEGNLILTTKTNWPNKGYTTSESQNNMLALKGLNANDTGILKLASDKLGNRANYKVFNKSATSNNKNGEEVLFTVPKGETKTITIAVWLEALDQSFGTNIPLGADIKVDFKFCSSWDVMDEITFRDYTAEQWIDNVDEDQSNKSMRLGVVNLDSKTTANYWYGNFTYNGGTTHTWTGQIPRAVQNMKFIWQGVTDSTTESATWQPPTRGGNTTFTAFGSTSGLWYDGEVERIGLSDATVTRWLKNQSPQMRVQIKYSGYTLNYSMTDSPTALDGADTWYCYIPADLDEVRFNRTFKSGTVYEIKNYWLGPNRGTETIYYALESGEEVELPEETGTTIYLRVPVEYANKFFDQNRLPAVSKMSQTNIDLVKKLGNNKQNLAQSGGYVVDGSAHADTWLGDQGRMTKLNDNLYSFHFDEELADGTYLTFWNKPQVNYYDLDNRTCIAPLVQYEADKEADKNVFILTNSKPLTNGAFNNAWIFDGMWISEDISDPSGGTTIQQPKQQNGRWGKPDKPTGTYTTYFVPPTGTTPSTVTATFVYDYFGYTVTLTKNSDGTFSTNEIPDAVTSITFSDGTNTWDAGSGRTPTNKYFVCSSTTAGSWKSTAVTPMKTIYLRPTTTWDIAGAWFWAHAWGGADGDFDVKMTKGSDGLYSAQIPEDATSIIFVRMNPAYTDVSWTGKWNQTVDLTIPSDSDTFTITSSTNGTWHYVEPEEPEEPEENVLYFKPNSNWKKDGARFAAYFFNNSTNKNTWVSMSGPDSDGCYSVTIPDGTWPNVIFCRMNGSNTTNDWNKNNKWNQTGNLTIPTDGKNLFTLSSTASWDGATTTWSKKS